MWISTIFIYGNMASGYHVLLCIFMWTPSEWEQCVCVCMCFFQQLSLDWWQKHVTWWLYPFLVPCPGSQAVLNMAPHRNPASPMRRAHWWSPWHSVPLATPKASILRSLRKGSARLYKSVSPLRHTSVPPSLLSLGVCLAQGNGKDTIFVDVAKTVYLCSIMCVIACTILTEIEYAAINWIQMTKFIMNRCWHTSQNMNTFTACCNCYFQMLQFKTIYTFQNIFAIIYLYRIK